MNAWTTVFPLLEIVVGATLQYWLSRSAESRKQLELLQPQSYVDYLRAVTKAAYASSQDALVSAQAEVADAKARLAVYGTSRVIYALARFAEVGAVLDHPKAHAIFVELVAAMWQKNRVAEADDLTLCSGAACCASRLS
jgi:multidrug efflux pump subunit AcrA (membrane-fusion protein)